MALCTTDTTYRCLALPLSLLQVRTQVTTVDLKIFVVKIFLWFAQTTKIKNTKYILQWIIIIARTFCSHSFKTQLGSYFAGDGLFFDTSRSLKLIANAWRFMTFRSVSDKLSVLPRYVPRRYSVPFCTLVVRQQLSPTSTYTGDYKLYTVFSCHSFLLLYVI